MADGSTVETTIAGLKGMINSPSVATVASDMIDVTKIYIYKGTETDYIRGNWYYYNGN
jgi:hypothetical protein